MKKRSFYIHNSKADQPFKLVSGYNVENPYGLDLAIRHGNLVLPNGKHHSHPVWIVTECSTGDALGHGETKDSAIRHAMYMIESLGLENILEIMNENIRQNGRAPEYVEEGTVK